MGGGVELTLLFTDIEGSTRMWERAPEAMSGALARHDELVRGAIEAANGSVFKVVGDAFCAAFEHAEDAVAAAVRVQRTLAAEAWPPAVPIRVRVGVHSGTCEVRDGDYFGPAVNRVARLHAIAHGGQIVVSAAAAELVSGRLPAGVGLRDMGRHRLKDLQRDEHVFQVLAPDLLQEFAPLRSLGNPELRHNLPELVSSMVGREAELADLRKLIEHSRVLTLVGAGGVGKTRLALQIGAELLDGSGDGVWFAELAAVRDPAQIPGVIADALGLQPDAAHAALDILTAALAERHLLLILDNCEHVIAGAAPLVSSLVRLCPKVSVLATSREPLRIDGERVYRVPSLDQPPTDATLAEVAGSAAVRLFVERGAALNPEFALTDANAMAIGSICRRLDGIPLAIELAAARLTSVTVNDLDRRLDQRFRLLSSGRRDALPRQQTLEALIAWSYDLLPEEERLVFECLAVFAGGFDIAAAEAVLAAADVSDGGALDVLGALVDKSLVQAFRRHNETRYQLLETIREFADRRLEQRDARVRSAALTAHRDHYLSFAAAVHRDQPPEHIAMSAIAGSTRISSPRSSSRFPIRTRPPGFAWLACSVPTGDAVASRRKARPSPAHSSVVQKQPVNPCCARRRC